MPFFCFKKDLTLIILIESDSKSITVSTKQFFAHVCQVLIKSIKKLTAPEQFSTLDIVNLMILNATTYDPCSAWVLGLSSTCFGRMKKCIKEQRKKRGELRKTRRNAKPSRREEEKRRKKGISSVSAEKQNKLKRKK